MSARTKAYVNFYSAMGTMSTFVKLNKEAQDIAKPHNLTIRFNVKNACDGLLIFKDGEISTTPNDGRKVDINLLCSSPEKFNDVVDGKAMPLPVKGLFKTLSFMGKPDSPFNVLSGKMSELMRKKDFSNKAEMELSTLLAFNAMVSAIAQIGNEDELGQLSAKRIANGEISVEIKDIAYKTLIVDGGKMVFKDEKCKNPRAVMQFADIDVAKGLIDGKLDAMSCLSKGQIVMKGFIPMLENLNKILNFVPKYLS